MSKLMGREEVMQALDDAIVIAQQRCPCPCLPCTCGQVGPLAQARATIAALWAERDALREALTDTRDALLAYDGHASDPDNAAGWSDADAYGTYQRASAALASQGAGGV